MSIFSGESRILEIPEIFQSEDFRRTQFTGQYGQATTNVLLQNEELSLETHGDMDQFVFIVGGEAEIYLDGKRFLKKQITMVCIKAGTEHLIRNIREEPLFMIITYTNIAHGPMCVQNTPDDPEC